MGRSLGINRTELLALKDKGLTIKEIAERFECSVATVEYHLNPKFRKRKLRETAERRKTEKYKEYFSKYYMKRYWSDPEFRSRRLEAMKRYMRHRYHSDPQFRSKRLEHRRKRYWTDSEYRSRYLEYIRNYKRRRRIAQKKSGKKGN